MEYKDERIEQLIKDNYHIRSDINQLTISVTELANTLKIREEDSKKIHKLENDVARLQSSLQTLQYIIPIICTILSIGVRFIHL